MYLACVAGAWVSDRVLGAERTLFFSACTVMLGHIALALLPGLGGVAVGLVLVALGSGGVKTSATSVVGSLYRRDDPRADAGFSIFYMGVNIGALVGPLLTGLMRTTLGFHYAFGLAAVGMAIGLGIYATGRRNLPVTRVDGAQPADPGRVDAARARRRGRGRRRGTAVRRSACSPRTTSRPPWRSSSPSSRSDSSRCC